MRKSNAFNTYNQFKSEVLRGRSGPLSSPVEDIADEMFQLDFDAEFASMWDSDTEDDEA
jgi:hypothetical protein